MNRPHILCGAIAALLVVPAYAQTPAAPPAPKPMKSASLGLVPYPAKKQTTAQQSKDDGECYVWTQQNTGIDLSQPVAAQAPAAPDKKHPRARGAVRGAAAGAVAGEIIDDKGGEGAAVGALAGAARSGREAKKETQQAQQQAEQNAQAANQDRLNTFRKGYSACMEARGYTVK